MSHPAVRTHERIDVNRWPSEGPLFLLALVVALALGLVAIVSVINLFYAAVFGALFFVMHLAFIAHVRGSAVRLGPNQFPELHAAVERIAAHGPGSRA
jgi:hypothetical protein